MSVLQVFQSIPSPGPEWRFFELGPFTVHYYALCILAGIIAATILTSRRLTNRGAEPGIVLDIILWAVPIGIIGARFYHVFTHPDDYFYEGADLLRTLYIWEGGNAIFGALLGGAVGAYIGSRMTGVRFWSFADALAPGMLLAQAMGRLGNYFNNELFGLPTTLPWGLEISQDNPAFPVGLPEGTLFHPTFLYEIIWNLVGVAVILYLERKMNLRWGKAFGVYLIWYGVGRSFFESIRVDPSEIFLGIRTNVWAAFAAVIVGLIIILVQRRRHTGAELSPYLPGREWQRPDPDADDDAGDEGAGDEVADAEAETADVHSEHTDSNSTERSSDAEAQVESAETAATSTRGPTV